MGSHYQDIREAVVVPVRPGAHAVSLVGRELRPQRGWSDRAAVVLEEEPVLALPDSQQPVSIWTYSPMRRRGCVFPFDELTKSVFSRSFRQMAEEIVGPACMKQVS